MRLLGWEIEPEELDSLPDGFRDYLERYNDALEAFRETASEVGYARSKGEPVDLAEVSQRLLQAMDEHIVVDDAAQFADDTAAA